MKASRTHIRHLKADLDKVREELDRHLTARILNLLDIVSTHDFKNDPESILTDFADEFFVDKLEKFCNNLDERIKANKAVQELKDLLNNNDEDNP